MDQASLCPLGAFLAAFSFPDEREEILAS